MWVSHKYAIINPLGPCTPKYAQQFGQLNHIAASCLSQAGREGEAYIRQYQPARLGQELRHKTCIVTAQEFRILAALACQLLRSQVFKVAAAAASLTEVSVD